jgi:YidC/Oxa1 family membrane protein insertase
MERSSITKWLVLGLAVFLVMQLGKQFFGASSATEPQTTTIRDMTAPVERAPEQLCSLEGPTFHAKLSTHGASLRQFVLSESRFDNDKKPMDLVTTSRESRMPLRTDLRPPQGDTGKAQVAYDDFDWKLLPSDGKSCTFTYEDGSTQLKKTVSLTDKPYELAVELEVKNVGAEPKKHRFAIEQTSWHTKKDVEGGFLRPQSPLVSETVAVSANKTERQSPSDFEADALKKPEFTSEKWRRTPGEGKAAAVSTVYFTGVVVPVAGEGVPAAETHIERWWDTSRFANAEAASKAEDPYFGYLYRARIAYPERELAPGASATYKAVTYGGPKAQKPLAAVSPAAPEVINLGTFAKIASGLIWYLHKLYAFTKSWGLAIVLLTITVRLVLFPLSISQIKNSMAMRRLKPEMDAINEKYKDDAAQRGLAIQELWRKNGVSNPVVGCLPMLVQMPVWWALYTALQTAVELYHVPFLWFRDLTAPDKFFIIPLVLGASSYVQQKLMPAQGDPQQQKMMMYMMPAIFTFMMLFLPAGLGVYMLTNSVLAIVQQLAVEKYLASHAAPSGQIEVREKTSSGDDKSPPALGKGKARVRG